VILQGKRRRLEVRRAFFPHLKRDAQSKTSETWGAPTTFSSTTTLHQKTDYLATVTARFGYAWAQGLFYVKGGAAWDKNTYSFNGTATTTSCAVFVPSSPTSGNCTTFNPAVMQSFNFTTGSDSRTGWTAGVGMEWAFTRNFSINAEYDFVDFGTRNITFNGGRDFPQRHIPPIHQRIEARL
jgi:opacity protein-like surface antigen